MRLILLLAWMPALMVASLVVAQEPMPLSLEAALLRAAEHHPAAVAARWERRAREGDALGGAAAFLPQLSAELGALRTDDPVAVFGAKLRQGRFTEADFAVDALNFPAPLTDMSTVLSVEQPVFLPTALSGRRAARAGARAGEMAEERAGQVAAFDVIRAYFGARLAADRLRVLEETLEVGRQTLAQVEKLRREGVVTVVDEQLARSRVSEVEAALAGSRAAGEAAHDLLLQLLGYPAGQPLDLTDSLVLPALTTPAPTERADLLALRAALEAREANVLGAQSQWIPSVAAFGNLRWHDDAFGVANGPSHWTMGLVVRWVPFRGLSDVGALHRAEAERDGARAELEIAGRRAGAEVRAATAEREAAAAALRATDAGLLQAAQAARAAGSRYAEGAATITELLAVRAAESSQRLTRLHALFQARVASAALQLAQGETPR